jgi:predicted Zn-dependent protease
VNLPTDGQGFAANYFDGKSAKRHEVIVARTREGLRITGPTVGEIIWRHTEWRRDVRMAVNDPVRLERGGESPEVLVVDDHRFLPAPTSSEGEPLDPDAELRRRRRVAWLIVPAVTVIVALTLLYAFFIPRMAERVAANVPVEWEESLGKAVTESFTANATTCTEPARVAALDKLVGTLVANGRGGRYTYQVTVVDDSIVNAFAAPGGQIVLFTGLLQQVESQEELAGVLAHEVQHVVLQHGAQGVLRALPAQLMASALFGNEGVGASVSQMAVTLGGLSYGRRDELEADHEGLRLLQEAQIDPSGMLSFFKRLADESDAADAPKLLNYLSTHPNSAERLTALTAQAQSATYTPRAVLSDAEWTAVRAACVAPNSNTPSDR